MDSESNGSLGVCKRKSACEVLVCFSCNFAHKSEDTVRKHVQINHNGGKAVKSNLSPSPAVGTSAPPQSLFDPKGGTEDGSKG